MIKVNKNLCQTHPHLINEWNYNKNSCTPENFTFGSGKKVWWICKKQHEWIATIASRTSNGTNCPYCSNKKVGYGNDLKSKYPKIAKQWNYLKNDCGPENFTYGSGKKVWWKCKYGHEWEANINSRTSSGTNCPYCSNKKVGYGNDLETNHPEIAKEWHPTKNEDLLPKNITPGSNKKVWWKCERGHEWLTSPNSRIYRGSNCPKCDNSSTSFPEQAIFHYTKQIFPKAKNRMILEFNKVKKETDIFIPELNLAIEYDGFYYHRDKEKRDFEKQLFFTQNNVNYISIRGIDLPNKLKHRAIIQEKDNNKSLEKTIQSLFKFIEKEYSITSFPNINLKKDISTINNQFKLTKNQNNIAENNQRLAEEWNYEKNGSLKPEFFSANSHTKVWWKCSKNHEWQAIISNRNKGRGCPYCNNKKVGYGNDLETNFPKLAKEWHPTKNGSLKPNQVLPYSNKKAWWKCHKGHEWQAVIGSRHKNGCIFCSGRIAHNNRNLEISFPNLSKEWHPTKNGLLKPTEVTPGSGKKVWWKCKNGHEWRSYIYNRTKGVGCPYCARKK